MTFVAMLPDFNRALTRKILQLQEYLPFLNLHINPERMLRRMDSERLMTWATTLMTQLSGGDGQHRAAGDDGDLYAV
ncbi:PerM family permease [Klebsiella pneumoniae subsp. pneumoniae]|nr:PerM family permease [Klebsiella pneumoniae subsp. pneumoniae]